jgi:hypothetical protein
MATVAGLFVWLAGASFGRIPAIIVGAAMGAMCGFTIAGHDPKIIFALAAVAVFLAIISQRVFFAFLVGIIAAVILFSIFVDTSVPPTEQTPVNPSRSLQHTRSLTARQSIEIVGAYALDVRSAINRASGAMPLGHRVIVVVAAVPLLVAGCVFRRITSAVCCSALGTAFIFAGMTGLLIFKGSTPITSIGNRVPFFYLVFAGMTAFGAVEQLVLGWGIRTQPSKDKSVPPDGQTDPGRRQISQKQSWRTT